MANISFSLHSADILRWNCDYVSTCVIIHRVHICGVMWITLHVHAIEIKLVTMSKYCLLLAIWHYPREYTPEAKMILSPIPGYGVAMC